MVADLVPSTAELDVLPDAAGRIVALVEPATELLARAATVTEAHDLHAQASALEAYAKAKGLATAAQQSAAVIVRRAEVRMGELLPVAKVGHPMATTGAQVIGRNERNDCRTLASAPDIVEEALAEGVTERRPILERIRTKADRAWTKADDVRLVELAEQGVSTPDIGVELGRSWRATANRLRRVRASLVVETFTYRELQRARRGFPRTVDALEDTLFALGPLGDDIRAVCAVTVAALPDDERAALADRLRDVVRTIGQLAKGIQTCQTE